MKNSVKQVNSSRVLQYATGIVLALTLAGCNATPAAIASNPYLAGSKTWVSTVNASSVSSIVSGFLSDQSWGSATNGWGPIELDLSNGDDLAGDGQKIRLSGVQYDKGLGVHADSSISFNLAAGCSRFKASVGLDDAVRNRTDTQTWAHINAQMGLLARCLKESGWVGLFHDQEPYNNPDGSSITQSDMWNYSWATKETDLKGLSAWADRYAEQAQIVSQNFPGMTYGWYHSASAGDGVSPSEYRQSENILYSLGAAYAEMVNAISDGSANLNVVDMGEIYDSAGSAFYQGAADYRRNSVQNNLSNLSANARVNWANIVQIGFMRMPGHTTTTSASGVTQELGDMWSSLSPNGIASYYDESGFGYAPSFITSGVQAFNDVGRR